MSTEQEDGGRPAMYTDEISNMFERAKDYMNINRDKQEEITRFSRDITWESKKVIFTLHKFFRSENFLADAKQRLNDLISGERYFVGLAKALEGQDLCYHHRRYTHCLQEFIEAEIFLSFLEKRRIPKYEELRDRLVLEVPIKEALPISRELPENHNTTKFENQSQGETVKKFRKLVVPLSISDYILGLGDFTGELMRSTVPTLTKPQWHTYLFQSFVMVRELYSQLSSVRCNKKDYQRKMVQMRSNVVKIETTVYKLKIKILLYGRLPDPKELRMIQESATETSNDRNNKRNDPEDSGVE